MKLPRYFWSLIGVLLILSYLIPIPLGTLRVAMGLSILVCSNLTFALFLQRRRRGSERFNSALTWIEEKAGEKLTKNLRITRPDNDPRAHFQ